MDTIYLIVDLLIVFSKLVSDAIAKRLQRFNLFANAKIPRKWHLSGKKVSQNGF